MFLSTSKHISFHLKLSQVQSKWEFEPASPQHPSFKPEPAMSTYFHRSKKKKKSVTFGLDIKYRALRDPLNLVQVDL